MVGTENARIIRDLFANPPKNNRVHGATILTLDGRSGAGKTHLAHEVKKLDPEVEILPIENFYRGWEGLKWGPIRLAREVLRPWAAGLPARARFWDWYRSRWQEQLTAMPFPVHKKVIIEGCGSGALELAAFSSALIWLEVPADIRFQRAMARDGKTFAPYWEMWARQESTLIATDRTPQRADSILRQ